MAQIDQSAVVTLNVIQTNNGITNQINKGFDSAEYALFDVALHVCFGVYHIKIYTHTIPEDVFIFRCKY